MKRKRIETSKLLLLVLLSGLGIVSLATMTFSFLYADASPLVTLIEGVTRLSAIAVGFYYWKAKAENLHKYKQDDKIGEISNEN